MSRSLRLAALGLLALAGPARAQITLTADDVRAAYGLGAVQQRISAALSERTVDLGTASTTAQAWSFPTAPDDEVEGYTARVVPAARAPRADRFPGATLALYADTTNPSGAQETSGEFYTLAASGARTSYGVAGVASGDGASYAIVAEFRPPLPEPATLRFGDTYRDRSTYVYTESPALPFFPAVGDSIVVETTTTVDAFGTVTLPDGSRLEVLRVVTDLVSVAYLGGEPPFRDRATLVAFEGRNYEGIQFQVDSTWTGGPATVTDYARTRVLRTATDAPAAPRPGALAFAAPAPNPARGPVALRFTLGAPGPVRLVAYDALGRAVAVVVDGPRGAGAHTASFDATALPPGAYVLRLDAEGRTATRTLVRAD